MSAPATIALAMSPEYCRPPSAITGTPAGLHASDASYTAVICGAPTPVTTRVVQIEPGPDADLHRVGTRVDERLRAGPGGDVAADDLDVPRRGVGLEPVHHVEQQPDVPVRGVGDEHVDAGIDQRGGALPRVAEVADRGGRPSADRARPSTRAGTARTSRSP